MNLLNIYKALYILLLLNDIENPSSLPLSDITSDDITANGFTTIVKVLLITQEDPAPGRDLVLLLFFSLVLLVTSGEMKFIWQNFSSSITDTAFVSSQQSQQTFRFSFSPSPFHSIPSNFPSLPAFPVLLMFLCRGLISGKWWVKKSLMLMRDISSWILHFHLF